MNDIHSRSLCDLRTKKRKTKDHHNKPLSVVAATPYNPPKYNMNDDKQIALAIEELKKEGAIVMYNIATPDQIQRAKILFWDWIEEMSRSSSKDIKQGSDAVAASAASTSTLSDAARMGQQMNHNNVSKPPSRTKKSTQKAKEKLPNCVDRYNPSTWVDKKWPMNINTGIIKEYIGQSKFMWYIRTLPNIRKFFEMWYASLVTKESAAYKNGEYKKLLVSLDGAVCVRGAEHVYTQSEPRLQMDQNFAVVNDPFAYVQCALNLISMSSPAANGAFAYIPRSHLAMYKRFKEGKENEMYHCKDRTYTLCNSSRSSGGSGSSNNNGTGSVVGNKKRNTHNIKPRHCFYDRLMSIVTNMNTIDNKSSSNSGGGGSSSSNSGGGGGGGNDKTSTKKSPDKLELRSLQLKEGDAVFWLSSTVYTHLPPVNVENNPLSTSLDVDRTLLRSAQESQINNHSSVSPIQGQLRRLMPLVSMSPFRPSLLETFYEKRLDTNDDKSVTGYENQIQRLFSEDRMYACKIGLTTDHMANMPILSTNIPYRSSRPRFLLPQSCIKTSFTKQEAALVCGNAN